MANEPSYQQQVAQMRQERAQREHVNRLQNIQAEYQQVIQEREAAAARGDRDEWDLRDSDCQKLEQDWQYLNPPAPPQPDPKMVEFLKRNRNFVERHGPAAVQALDMAHAYATRPRTGSLNPQHTGMGLKPNSPEYFDAMRNLMAMYGKDVGTPYDPNDETLTPNEAAKISGVSAKTYNRALRDLAAQGKFADENNG